MDALFRRGVPDICIFNFNQHYNHTCLALVGYLFRLLRATLGEYSGIFFSRFSL